MKNCSLRSLALALTIVVASTSSLAQTYLFREAEFPSGTQPFGVATADFNKDGLPDLAVANSADNSVSVLLNRSRGKFSAKVDYAVATAYWVTTGDFNNDSNPDLAVSGFGGSSISILLGNGDGTFQPFTSVSAPHSSQVVTADFNRDGKLDLAVVDDFSARSISVLLGNGNGTFQTPVNYATPNAPFGLAIGDFNNDGKLDMATANNIVTDGAVTGVDVFLGKGDGSFQAGKLYESDALGLGESIVSGDFNHDGKLDVALGDSDNTAFVLILLGDGTGSFTTGESFDLPAGSASAWTAADVNGDGSLDIIGAAGAINVYLGNGDGTFQAPGIYAGGSAPGPVPVADFDGDGKLDLAVTTTNCPLSFACGNGVAVVLLGNGRGAFSPVRKVGTGLESDAIRLADFNQDGKADIAFVSENANALAVSLNPKQLPAQYDSGYAPVALNTADLNHDGFLDIVVTTLCGLDSSCQKGGSLAVLLNNGNGTFAAAVQYRVGMSPEQVTIADFNGDGSPDLVVPNYSWGQPGAVKVLLNHGDGTFGAPASYLVGVDPISVAVADFNHDGKLDLAVTNNAEQNASTFSVLLGNGDGTFQPHQDYSSGGYAAGSIATADLNRDGKPDLVIANNSGVVNYDNVAVLLGNGDGTFETPATYPVPGNYPGSLVIADLDGDGNQDVAATGNFSAVLVYRGTATGTLRPALQYSAPFAHSIAAGDLNGDGNLDIAASDNSSSDASITLYFGGRR